MSGRCRLSWTAITFLLIAETAIPPASLFAASDQIGTRGFPFLRIGTDGRSLGMGEAVVSSAVGPNAPDWNPGGLALVNRPALSTSFLDYVLDGVHAGSIAFAQPVGTRGSVGLSARYFRVGDIPLTTEDNPTGEELGNFASTDIALKLTVAYRVSHNFLFGLSGSILSGSIDEYGALGVSTDFGFLWRNALGPLRIGGALRHLGSQTSAYLEEVDPLPTQFVIGGSYPLFGDVLLVATDYHWTVDWGSALNSGAEWQVVDDFFLRGGYRSRFSDLRDRSDEPGIAGMTFGVGFRKVRSYAIDYAYASLADLGGTHRFTLSWDFR